MKERMRVQNELKDSNSEEPSSRRNYESDEDVKKEKIRKIKRVMKSNSKSKESFAGYNNTLEMGSIEESEEDERVAARSRSQLPERGVRKERTHKLLYDTDYKSLEVQLRDMEEQLRTMTIDRGYNTATHSKSFSYLNNAFSVDYGKKLSLMMSYEEPKDVGTIKVEHSVLDDKQKVTMLEHKLDKLEKDVGEMKVNFEKLVETINKAIESNTFGQNNNVSNAQGFGTNYSGRSRYEGGGYNNEQMVDYPVNDYNNDLVSHILHECNRMINDHLGQSPHYSNPISNCSSPKRSEKKDESLIDFSFEKSI
jgi:hypothetical protein